MSLTLVTVLFDLARRNPNTRRSMDWLIENGQKVLELDHPMVIFTEKHLVGKLAHERAIRELCNKTKIVPLEFEELPHYSMWRSMDPAPLLIENRNREKDHLDNFSINWEKPGLIAQVAKENPFGTTHVGWINLGIQNVKVFNFKGWEDAFDPPDKVRIHQQRYLNHHIVDAPDFYHWGRCVTAGGFLTGSTRAIIEFSGDFYEEFNRALSMGRGPGDEDVIGTLLVKHPEKYVISYGDYGQLLCNAKRPRWGGKALTWEYNYSLYWMIKSALDCNDLPWAANLWHQIMDSKRDGFFVDDTTPIEQFRELLEPLRS